MTLMPECPSSETLALLPDGRASRKVRRKLMAHLDGCPRCRTVLAYAGQYEASRTPSSHSWLQAGFRRITVPAVAPRFSLAFGIVLVTVLGALFLVRSLDPSRPGLGELSTEARVGPLFEGRPVSLARDELWTSGSNSFSFGSGWTPTQRAFQMGVWEVDFRVAIERGFREEAESLLRSLSGLDVATERWSALEADLASSAPKEDIIEELARVDVGLHSELDPVALDVGRFVEVSRLAAVMGQGSYFGSPEFARTLDELDRRDLPLPVRQELRRVRAHAGATVSEGDLKELQRAFRQLALLR